MSHFSLTTPIYYPNDAPHIGHTYTTVVADSLARWHRLCGEEVFFLTGNDVHGDKMAEVARERGESPASFAARMSQVYEDTWQALGISHDRFIRTTDPDHVLAVQQVLQAVYDAGEVDFREYEGLYCVGCERFLTDRDLVDGKCRDHERVPEPRTESNYFFRMSEHFGWLLAHIEANPEFIRPERYKNEVLGMLREESGLGDLCISRPKSRLDWGIELPFDRDYVCYVWFDALINYATGLGYPQADGFEARWAAVEHLIGKDILKPHGIFWPCMLHAIGLPPYRHLHVHGFWNVADRKVSKSLGNMISPLAMKERYGFEPFRYFLLRDMSYGLDASFTEPALVARVNADLANNLGNLASRTLNMIVRYCEGRVPEPGECGALESELAEAAAKAGPDADAAMRRLEPHRALEAIFQLVDAANKYLDTRSPWQAAKDPAREAEVRTTLYTTAQALRSIALLLAPFLPEAGAELLARLGQPDALAGTRLPEDAGRWDALPAGSAVRKGKALFPRLELPEDPAE